MKKLWMILLVATLALSLVACGSKEEKEKEELRASLEAAQEEREKEAAKEAEEKKAVEKAAEEEAEAADAEDVKEETEKEESSGEGESLPEAMVGTKTMAYFVKHMIDGAYTMEMQTEFDGMTTVSTTAVKDGMTYTKNEVDGVTSIGIMKDDYMYMLDTASKLCIKMPLEMAEAQEIFAEEAEHYETAVSTGETEVKGTPCFYEEFTVEGSAVKYCFVGDDLKFIVMEMEGSEYIMEILKMERGADDALFEIPDDYTMMEM